MFNNIHFNTKKSIFAVVVHLLYWTPSAIGWYVVVMYRWVHYSQPVKIIYYTNSVLEFLSFYLFYFLIIPLFYRRRFTAFIIYSIVNVLLLSLGGVLFLKIMEQRLAIVEDANLSYTTGFLFNTAKALIFVIPPLRISEANLLIPTDCFSQGLVGGPAGTMALYLVIAGI
jgi:hypothetical protein